MKKWFLRFRLEQGQGQGQGQGVSWDGLWLRNCCVYEGSTSDPEGVKSEMNV